MSDIVERLRKDAAMNLELPEVTHLQQSGRLEIEAADEIERLRAERKGEIDANRGHAYWETAPREELLNAFRFQGATTKALTSQLDEARAERDALRALLRRVQSCGLNEEPHGVGFTPSKQENKAGELARDIDAALGKEGKDERR